MAIVDDGLFAALGMAQRIFSHASRRTGRTERLLHRAGAGDIIIVPTEQEARRLRLCLRELGKEAVTVAVVDVRRMDRSLGMRRAKGEVHFSHDWIEAWVEFELATMRPRLDSLQESMSSRPMVEHPPSDMEMRFRSED